VSDPINEIKNRLDVVDVISGYIKLQKAGANFKSQCPFHSEKDPSFIVSPAKQIWHCFGACDEGGDIFKFIMKMEGLEFPDTLRLLADKAGVVLKKQDPKLRTERQKLYNFHERSADYFERCLDAHESAKKYLKKRKINKKTIKEFRIGYAPQNTKTLKQFQNRIIFPICDLNSQVVGFTARIFDVGATPVVAQKKRAGTRPAPTGPKYINSPESLIYKKSLILYGLDKAKQEIRKKDFCILVEGNIDVMMSHQAGVKNTIACSGSAFSIEQLKIIKRYTNNLFLAFDSDEAGSKATKKTIDLAIAQSMNVKIIILKHKDPADLIAKDPKEWQKAIKQAKPIMQYYFDDVFEKFDSQKIEHKKEIAKILLPIIKRIPNKIEQMHWLQELGRKINIDEKILLEAIEPEKKIIKSQEQNNRTNKPRIERLKDRLESLKKDELIIEDPKKEIKICQNEIKLIELKEQLKDLTAKIKKAEQEQNSKLVKKLLEEFNYAAQKINNYTRQD